MNILTLMQTFSIVVETGSFTAAAEQLGLSKSFVSKQISLLEQDLGARLLYRTTRKLSLSDEGSQFYEHCKLIMMEAENARNNIINSQSAPRGNICITLPQSLIVSGVGGLLIEFQSQYPDISLNVVVSGRVEDLIEEGIDIALRVGQLEDSSLISRRLADCTFQVVASTQYIEKWGMPTQPTDLLNHNCLIYSDSKLSRGWPFRLPNGELITVKVKGNVISNEGSLIVDGVLKGVGIGFGPSYLFKSYIEQGSLQVLLTNYSQQPTSITALYPYSLHLPTRIKLLIDFLAERL